MISIFTPTNNTTWLQEAWDSLSDQPVDFEWIIGLNGNPDCSKIPSDPRIRLCYIEEWKGVGHAKNTLCMIASGDILLELDHDDILAENALLEVENAFSDPEIGFVYSDCAEWVDETGKPFTYSHEYGWETYPCKIRGRELIAMSSFSDSARALSQILFSPNHLRAWRKSIYLNLGGHDVNLPVADDYDLMARSYLATKFKHIKKALYGYRRRSDGGNTWLKNCKEIQRLCGQGADLTRPTANQPLILRDKYLHKLVERQCELRNQPKVDLGGGIFGANGWTTIDISGNPDIKHDIFGSKRLPFKDNSIGAFRAFDFLEHGEDMDAFWLMEEIYRCLAPGGWFLSKTPHALGIGASCDPSHKSRWDERRFLYWCHKDLRPFLQSAYPEAKAWFHPVRLYKENFIMGPGNWRFDVPYVIADLVVSKGERIPLV